MTGLDHLFVLIFAAVFPVVGFIGFQRLLHKVETGLSVNRSDLYRNTALNHWALFFVGLVIWANAERPWSALGLTLQIDTAFLAGASLTVAGIFVLLIQVRQAKTADEESLAAIKAQFGRLELIIPQNGGELARFYLLSVTAGIVEELLWRGYLIWYLGQVMPLWAAALVSTIGFGLAHAYQGLANLPKITLVGAVFAGLYLLSGSIWLPILLHVAVDILQGRLAYEAIHRSDSAIAVNDGKGAKSSP